jgi:transposase-like protein
MLNGECVAALSERYQLPRSMMYRWRDAYRKDPPDGYGMHTGTEPVK